MLPQVVEHRSPRTYFVDFSNSTFQFCWYIFTDLIYHQIRIGNLKSRFRMVRSLRFEDQVLTSTYQLWYYIVRKLYSLAFWYSRQKQTSNLSDMTVSARISMKRLLNRHYLEPNSLVWLCNHQPYTYWGLKRTQGQTTRPLSYTNPQVSSPT